MIKKILHKIYKHKISNFNDFQYIGYIITFIITINIITNNKLTNNNFTGRNIQGALYVRARKGNIMMVFVKSIHR